MLTILLGIGFGGLLMYSFIREYLSIKHTTEELLNIKKNYTMVDNSASTKVFNGFGVLLALVASYLGHNMNDMLNVSLGIALALMFIGQYFLLTYRNCYWFNEEGLITNGMYIKYKSVNKIVVSRALLMSTYNIKTFSGKDIGTSKSTALFLSEKTKKSISKN